MNIIMRSMANAILFLCYFCLTAALGNAALAAGKQDQDGNKNFEIELSTGVEYRSKVSVDELDTFTDSGDVAALLGAKLKFGFDITRKTSVNIDYSFSQSLHDELDQFDLQTHYVSLDLAHDFGKVDVGVSHMYLDSGLDGSDFMTYQKTTLYLTALLGRKVFVRAELGFANKEFDTVSERDAKVQSAGTDWFFFLNGPKTYVLLGYRFDQEDAVAPEHDYKRHNFKIHLIHRFDLFRRQAKFNIGWRYEDRDYSDITPSIGVVREEQRIKIRASLELPLTDRFETVFKYEIRDYESNLPEANRADYLASIELIARF